MAVPASASAPLPSGGQVVAGAATFDRSAAGDTLTVGVATDRAVIDWASFSVAGGHAAHFVQPAVTSAVLNRVISGDPSQIHGSLTANGALYLINPNGVLVGPGGTVEAAGGFVASTLDLKNADFLNGAGGADLHFRGDSTAAVVNLGAVTALDGDIFLIAQRVEIGATGTLSAPGGHVGLAAGNEVLLLANPVADDDGAEPVGGRLLVAPSNLDAEGDGASNAGLVEAAVAEVRSAGNLYALAINNTGTVRATGTAETPDGRVLLVNDGGVTDNSGLVAARDADGTGGDIDVLGEFLSQTGTGTIEASGEAGGGTVHLGGSQQGQGPLPNAAAVFLGPDTAITADSLASGDAGRVIVYSEQATRIYGQLSAAARGSTGAGGFIETSGHEIFDIGPTPEAFGAGHTGGTGAGGTWLIDPAVLNFTPSGSLNIDTMTAAGTRTFSSKAVPLATNATLAVTSVNTALNGGLNVVVTALDVPDGSEINFLAGATAISKTAGGAQSLTFNADVVRITQSITSTSGALSVIVNADTTFLINSAVTTLGGAFTVNLDTAGAAQGATATVDAGTVITTGGGAVTFNGGTMADTFNLEITTLAASTFNGGMGVDTFNGPDATNAWSLDATTATATLGAVRVATDVEIINGGTSPDTFTLTSAAVPHTQINGLAGDDIYIFNAGSSIAGAGLINGNAGRDTVNLSALAAAIDVTLTNDGPADGFDGTVSGGIIPGGFDNIDVILGSAVAGDTITGDDVTATWTADGTNAVPEHIYDSAARDLEFSGFSNFTGGTGADTFNVNGDTTANLRGGLGADIFNLADTVDLTGFIGGSDHLGAVDGLVVDTLNLAEAGVAATLTSSVAMAGYSGTAPAQISVDFTEIDTLNNTGGGGTLTSALPTDIDWFLGATQTLGGATSTPPLADPVLTFSGFTTLNGSGMLDRFNLLANTTADLNGNGGIDIFNFDDGVTLTGAIDGGGAPVFGDLINFAGDFTVFPVIGMPPVFPGEVGGAYSTTLSATLTGVVVDGFAGTVGPITGGFSDIDILFAGTAADTLTGLNLAGTWDILDGALPTAGGLDPHLYTVGGTPLSFSQFETLQGGTAADTFDLDEANTAALTIRAGAGADTLDLDFLLTGTFDGEAGGDTADFNGIAGPITVDLTALGATDGYDADEPASTGITGVLENIDTIIGTTNATAIGDRIRTTLINRDSNWTSTGNPTITQTDALTAQSIDVTDFETIDAGSGADSFAVTTAALNMNINAGGGDDLLSLTAGGTLTGVPARFFDGQGAGDSDTVRTGAGGELFIIDGADTGSVFGVTNSFFNTENVDGAGGGDTFEFRTGGTLSGTVTGGGGDDLITVVDATIFNLTGDGSGDATDNPMTITTINAFTGVENLTGGANPDRFNVGATTTTDIDAGDGDDLIEITGGVTITGTIAAGAGGETPDVGDLLRVTGAAGTAFSITAADGGTLTELAGTFSDVENIEGSLGSDTFTVVAGGSLTGTAAATRDGLDGRGGTDTLVEAAGAQTVTIGTDSGGADTGADDAGNSTNITNFVSIENVSLGAGDDTADLTNGRDLSGTLDGQGGLDRVNLDAGANTVNITGSGTINGMAFGNVELVVGNTGADAFNITASTTIDLVGGEGMDSFVLSDGVEVTSSGAAAAFGFADNVAIHGDGVGGTAANDTISFAAYSTAVGVTLNGVDGEGFRGETVPDAVIDGAVVDGFDGIDIIVASAAGGGTFTGPSDQGYTWTLGPAGQTLEDTAGPTATLDVSGFDTLQGGTDTDLFVVADGNAAANADILNGGGGTDFLEVDFTLGVGFPIPASGITFNGEAGADEISLNPLGAGPTYTSVTHTFSNNTDGSITVVNGTTSGTIDYTGLAPIRDDIDAGSRTFTFLGADETITVNRAPALLGLTLTDIDSTLGEFVRFASPVTRLIINSRNGDDGIEFGGVGAGDPGAFANDFAASVVVNAGDADDLVTFDNNALRLPNDDVTINGATVDFDTDINDLVAGTVTLTIAGDFTAGGLVTLTDDLTFTANAFTFGSAIIGDAALDSALTLIGDPTFNGVVGRANELASVDITGATTINGGAVNTTGTQTYQGAGTVALGADATLTASAAGNLQVDGVITGGGNDLTLDFGGTWTNGIVAAVNLGTNTLVLNFDTGTVADSAAITAASLELLGAAAYDLDLPAGHDVDTLAGDSTSTVEFNDSDDLTIGTVNNTAGLGSSNSEIFLTTGGALTIAVGIDAGTSQLNISAGAAATQGSAAGAAIIADDLRLIGTGPYTLTNPRNDVNILAASTTEAISYRDVDDLTVASVTATIGDTGTTNGITTTDDNLALQVAGRAGVDSLVIGVGVATEDIAIGTGDLTVTVDSAAAGQAAVSMGAGAMITADDATFNIADGDTNLGGDDFAVPGDLAVGSQQGNAISGTIDFNTPREHAIALDNTVDTTLAALTTRFLFINVDSADVTSTEILDVSGEPELNRGVLEVNITTSGSLSFTNIANDFIDVELAIADGDADLADQNAFDVSDTALGANSPVAGGFTVAGDLSLRGFGGVTGNPPNQLPVVGTVDLFTDTGALEITGTTTIRGLEVNFDNAANTFGGDVQLIARNVVLVDDGTNPLNFLESSVTDTLDATVLAGNDITQSGRLFGASPMRFTLLDVGAGTITLTTATNELGILSIIAGTATISQNGTLIIESADIGTDLTLTSNLGDVVDRETNRTHLSPAAAAPPIGAGTAAGAIEVDGIASFNTAAAGTRIRLVDEANLFAGSVTFVTPGDVLINTLQGGNASTPLASTTVLTFAAGVDIDGDLIIQLPVDPNVAHDVVDIVDDVAVSDGTNVMMVDGTVDVITTGAVDLGGAAHDFGNVRIDTSNGSVARDIAVMEAGDVVLDLIVTGGMLTATSTTGSIVDRDETIGGETIFQGTVRVVGTSSFTAGAGDVVLNSPQNSLGGAVTTAAGDDVTLTALSAIDLADQVVPGDLTVTGLRGITQAGAGVAGIDVTGVTTLTTGPAFDGGGGILVAADLDLDDADNDFDEVRINTGQGSSALITDDDDIQLGASLVNGDLVVISGGAAGDDITQVAGTPGQRDLFVAGTAVFNGGADGDVTLGTGANQSNSVGRVRFLAQEVTYEEDDRIIIGGSDAILGQAAGGTDVDGVLALEANGSISGEDDTATFDNHILVGGATSLTVNAPAAGAKVGVTLTNTDNDFDDDGSGDSVTITNNSSGGTLQNTDGAHSLLDTDAIVLGTFAVDGPVKVRAGGAVTQAAGGVQTLSTMEVVTTGAAIAVTLTDAANAFGTLVLGEIIPGNPPTSAPLASASVVEVDAITFGEVNLTGNLTATTAGGSITDTVPITVGGTAILTTTLANADILIDNGSGGVAAGTFATAGAGGDVVVHTTGAFDFAGASVIGGDLSVSADAVTQTMGITVGGDTTVETTLDATASNNDITLSLPGNALTGTVRLTGDDVSLANTGDLVLGSGHTRGNLTVSTTTGSITDGTNAALVVDGISFLTSDNADATRDIVLDSGLHSFAGTVSASSDDAADITMAVAGSLDFNLLGDTANNTVANLDLNAPGGLTQSGSPMIVTGTATFAAQTGDITLTNATNNFATVALTNTSASATLRDANAFAFGATTVQGDVTLTAGGAVTDNVGANVQVAGRLTVDAGATNGVTLNSADNRFGSLDITGSGATLVENSSMVFAAVNLNGGNLSATTTSGNVTQTGAILVADLAVTAAGLIDLENAGNRITSTDTLSAGGSIKIFDSDANLAVDDDITAIIGAVRQPVIIRTSGAITTVNVAGVINASNVTLVNSSGTFSNGVGGTLFDNITGFWLIYGVDDANTPLGGLVEDFMVEGFFYPTAPGRVGNGRVLQQ